MSLGVVFGYKKEWRNLPRCPDNPSCEATFTYPSSFCWLIFLICCMETASPCHGVRLYNVVSHIPCFHRLNGGLKIYQNTQRTSVREFWLLAHCSKQVLWILFPHAALHHTISSLPGSNSVKQIGQSPEISLRLLLWPEEPGSCGDACWDDSSWGAWEKISRSSLQVDRTRLE